MSFHFTKFRIPLRVVQSEESRVGQQDLENTSSTSAANDDAPHRRDEKPQQLTVETWDINGAF